MMLPEDQALERAVETGSAWTRWTRWTEWSVVFLGVLGAPVPGQPQADVHASAMPDQPHRLEAREAWKYALGFGATLATRRRY